jgi:hypothetical protein
MRKNYWPHAIVASIILIIISCAATIVTAIKNPVELDNFYLDRYQNVDENINEIEASQRRFDSKFNIVFLDFNSSSDTKFSFKISPKNDSQMQNLQAMLMLTKPDTNRFNQELNTTFSDFTLTSSEVKFKKPGRWQALLKINDGNDTGFYKYDIYVE